MVPAGAMSWTDTVVPDSGRAPVCREGVPRVVYPGCTTLPYTTLVYPPGYPAQCVHPATPPVYMAHTALPGHPQ